MTSITIQLGTEDTVKTSLTSIMDDINESLDLTIELEASLPLDWSALDGRTREDWILETAPIRESF